MTATQKAGKDWRGHCREALLAFSLANDDASDFTVLKDDEDSLVLRLGLETVLKQRRRPATLTRLETTAALEATLSDTAYGALCPARLKPTANPSATNRATRWLFEASDGSIWSASRYVSNGPVFDWLDAPSDWTNEQARAAGALLAQLHKVGQELARQANEAEPLAALPVHFTESTNKHKSILQELANGKTLTQMQARLATAVKALEGRQGGDKSCTLVHGDFHPGNVLFAANKALCVIDLDYAHRGQALFDVAYAQITFGPERAEALIDGYWGNPPADLQRRELALYEPIAAAWIVLWCLENWHAKSFAGRLESVLTRTLALL